MNSIFIGGSQSRLLLFCLASFISSAFVLPAPMQAQEALPLSTAPESTPLPISAGFIPKPTTQAAPQISTAPREVELPSELPSGDATNDIIRFKWYPAHNLETKRGPAVILLHPLGREDQSPMHEYARYLARRGIACAVMTLPYHGLRLPEGESTMHNFVSPEIERVVRTFKQSAADASTVLSWMSTQPEVDGERLGGVGVSVGAIVLHLLMGQDPRVKAGVAALGGGALAESYRNNPVAQSKLLFRLFSRSSNYGKVTPEDLKRLDEIDPLTYANSDSPRNVLMIEAARDIVIQPRSAQALWEALGRPPIQWIDTNHFAAIDLAKGSTMRAAAAYLKSVWDGQPLASGDIPNVHAPTIKAGIVMNLDSVVTPAVQWQFAGLGTYQHRTLFGVNVGMSGRGPFLGVAANVTSYFDLGVARRWNGNRIKPYASLHFVY
jgi:dienelactone hydrolase